MDAPIYFLEGETMLEVNRLSNESAGCSPPLPPTPASRHCANLRGGQTY